MSWRLLPDRHASSPALRWAGSSNVGPTSVHAVAHHADVASPTASTQATSISLLRASAMSQPTGSEGTGRRDADPVIWGEIPEPGRAPQGRPIVPLPMSAELVNPSARR